MRGEGGWLDRTQEVAGSSPASSTIERPANAGLCLLREVGQPGHRVLAVPVCVNDRSDDHRQASAAFYPSKIAGVP